MFEINNDINQNLVTDLQSEFSGKILSSELQLDMLCFEVAKNNVLEILTFLRNHSYWKFNFLTTLCGVHYPDKNQLGVVYHLHSFSLNLRIRIKAFTPIENPVFQTVTSIYPTTNWMERETYDFFGIIFEGHPNLKRILNVDEMTDFPLRKEFPLEDQTREDKDDTKFGR